VKTQRYPLDIIICCDGMPFHGDTIKESSLGGSETAALQMAQSLQKKGNNVIVFSHCKDKEGIYDGVEYKDISSFLQYATIIPHDVLIIERRPDLFSHTFNSKINILWQHDIAIIRGMNNFRMGSWNIDKCFVMSEFQKNQSIEINGLPEDYYFTTKNGLNLDLFNNLEDIEREPKKLICGARPERGLDNFLFEILPRLLEKDPEIKLYLTSYNHKVPEMEGFYNALKQQANKYPNNVFWMEGLTKKELYKQYKSSTAYVYYSDFEEISCISAMEAMACGLPFISRDCAALKETVPSDAGILLSGFDSAKNPESINQYTNLILNLLNNSNKLKAMGKAGIDYSKTLDWDLITDQWIDEFYRIFENNTKNKFTLAKHFIFHSDIISAKKIIEKIPDSREKEILKEEIKPWDVNFKGHIAIGKLEDNNTNSYLNDIGGMDNLLTLTENKKEPHWPMLDRWLKDHPKVKTIMDYGCFTGRYAIPLANNNKDYYVYGVDISENTLKIAKEVSNKISKFDNIKFICGNYDNLEGKIKKKLDCILLFDTLEHLPHPTKAIDKLEKYLKDDGWMLIITPAGPGEADSFGEWENRIHIHHFEKKDLKDLFSKKKSIKYVYMGRPGGSKIDNSRFGKILTSYQKSKVKTGNIDYNRKFLLQKPKQTISTCIIAKNEENNIGECLENVRPYVDEIIVCDTGSTDNTKKIAKKYNAKVIDGSNPLEYGFETPRNESIKDAVGDWIMWIDADERFLQGRNLGKYLKDNVYDAYSIRQHHFSCSPPNAFKPDLPCRIFRNKKGISFRGILHEHPETGVNKGPGLSTILNDLEIAHGGYYTEDIRRKRFERNYPLLLKDRQKYPDRILGKFFEIRDYIHLARYTLEKTRGQLNPQIVEWCEKAIDMFRKDFLGKDCLMGGDVINFYSDALKILNRGFEVSWVMGFGKNEAKLNGNKPTTLRFDNQDDLTKYFTHSLKTNTNLYTSRYF